MTNLDSYPPPLRLLHPRHDLDSNISINPTHSDLEDPIPVVDLLRLKDEKEKLEEACKDWGIFRLVNHGVPLTLLNQLQCLAKQVFSMPFESKQASCDDSPISYFWGTPALTPSGTALSGGTQKINWVEGFNVPLGQINQFQPQLPLLQSFRGALMEYGKHLWRIATSLLEATAETLEMNVDKCKGYMSESTGNVRVYRYPHRHNPNSEEEEDDDDDSIGWGMDAHTDSSVISILNQDDQVSGLEVLKDDQWLTAKPIPNTLIVNLGDMMQAISDDKYKSVTHRVKMSKHKERISVCYFVFPDEQVVIESSNYKPFTYNDFRAQVQEDVKAVGYKVGLSRFSKTQNAS